MELLYLYAENYAGTLLKQGFQFSTRFIVNYDKGLGKIELTKNEKQMNDFYGKTITDITAIVGKNGSGKTTLLDIIGLDKKTRIKNCSYSSDGGYSYSDRYFMIYYAPNKDMFYIEGLGKCNIENIENLQSEISRNISKKNTRKQEFFSFFFKKEMDKYKLADEDDISYSEERELSSIIYINDTFGTRMKEQIELLSNEKNILLKRNQIERVDLVDWYKTYVDFCGLGNLESKNTKIVFQKYDYRGSHTSFFSIPSKIMFVEKFLDEQSMIIEENIEDFFRYFQSNILNNFYTIYNDNQKTALDISKFNDFVRKLPGDDMVEFHTGIFEYFNNYILSALKSSRTEVSDEVARYYNLMMELFFSLIDIKDFIIPAVDSFELAITSEYNEKITAFLNKLNEVEAFVNENEITRSFTDSQRILMEERAELELIERMNLFVRPFSIKNIRMSKGEEKLVTVFSKILHEINKYVRELNIFYFNNYKKNIIILLDEIDECMHPEWSRSMINIMVNFLDTKKETVFNEKYISELAKVQIILSTHSPLVLSDLNNEDIIFLYRQGNEVLESKDMKLNKTFAQNIHNILYGSFFMDASIGEFSRSKINDIIKILNSKNYVAVNKRKEIKNIIDIIGEPLLKSKLEQMYKLRFPEKHEHIKELKKEKEILYNLLKKSNVKEGDKIMESLQQVIDELENKSRTKEN